ncbi:MAG: 16S rRNA (guanine(527)-N(7))-methyltransferase RsmG [Clostridia bacterium]|nr:16S rRNA (guanine(527)-N(7))-methyltransferase RsmG [Clostridia bacterium]MBQ9785794.1 16S rRNA (guanine(527)-N(7))-methyltransferase RsmG [Clostridia bacterium]
MEYTEFEALFRTACSQNALLAPDSGTINAFYRFTEHLLKVNETTNLTAIRNIPDVIYKHYVDSLLVSAHIPAGARVLDIGCGPGFPSIPLAITRPDLSITALDSTAKKITFVQESADLLRLDNLTAISGRAEDAAIRKKLGTFDVVVSRAVARMNVLCELCIPYLKIDGHLIALKGAKAQEELDEAQNAIKTLGGGEATLRSTALHINDTKEARGSIEVTKISPTPPKYPRVYATILKKPL